MQKHWDVAKEMEDMMSFSSIGNRVANSNTSSRVIQRTYITETKIDQNGNRYQEKYMSHDQAVRSKDGNTISERQQAYHNTRNDLQRIAQERQLNHQGRKVVHERVGNGQNYTVTNNYRNLHENAIESFDRDWESFAEGVGFYDGVGKRLKYDEQQPRQKPSYRQSQVKTTAVSSDFTNGYARRRQNDIQPTQPGRIALPSSENARMNSRNTPRTPVIALGDNNAGEPRHANADAVRGIAPRRYENNRVGNVVGGGRVPDSQGNFKNQNAQNAMPRAG